jgi:hypothetical protein
VYFPSGAFGLPKDCVAQADALTQLRVMDLVQPPERLGILDARAMESLVSAIGHVITAECRPA